MNVGFLQAIWLQVLVVYGLVAALVEGREFW